MNLAEVTSTSRKENLNVVVACNRNPKAELLSMLWEVHLKNRIEIIRKEKGIKQEEFAKAMGVSRQTISSLENGRYNPSILLAYKIAKYFEMTIEEVFLFEEEEI